MATCLRCGNEWTPRKENPRKCPSCQNPNWNRETRKRKIPQPTTKAEATPACESAPGRGMEAVPVVENDTLSLQKARAEELIRMLS